MNEKITRKDFFKRSAIITTGVSVAAVGSGLLISQDVKGNSLAEDWPAPYTSLDVEKARINAHDDYCTSGKGCSYATFNAIIKLIRAELPAFPSFPTEIMVFGHGGVAGWGTICGAINGAAAAISLVCDKAASDQLVSELCGWYTQVQIPSDISNTYAVDGDYTATKSDEVLPQNVSDSVLCHISVSKWCVASDVSVSDLKRKERCARLSGDVAAKAVELLNDHYGSGFIAEYVPPASIASCLACHGSDGMKKNVASNSSCVQCHGENPHSTTKAAEFEMPSTSFEVKQNYPNPFSSGTTINFSLVEPESVSVEIYNLEGKRMRTLISNEYHNSGVYSINWDGTNDRGGSVKAGIYMFRFRAGSKVQTISMMKI